MNPRVKEFPLRRSYSSVITLHLGHDREERPLRPHHILLGWWGHRFLLRRIFDFLRRILMSPLAGTNPAVYQQTTYLTPGTIVVFLKH
jgi:hypothetical protein